MSTAVLRTPSAPRTVPSLSTSRARMYAQISHWVVPGFYVNLLVVPVLFAVEGGFAGIHDASGAVTTAGRLTGLVAVNLCLVQLLLMGRNPFLDRLFGMDRMARWHRIIGHATFDLIAMHVALIAIGYALMSRVSIGTELTDLVLHTRDVLMATASLVLFTLVVVTSVRIARRHLRYETWYFVHLYVYLAIALSLPHQIVDGKDFAHGASQLYWSVLYAVAISSLLGFRVLLPLINTVQQGLRVERVVRESDDTISIYIHGKNVKGLGAEAGQFFIWRFLARGQWWQAHPYSLSAAPHAHQLRITVKDLGRGSGELSQLRPGTRVIAEGPYGAFTPAHRVRRKVLFVAGGVGITPIRAMLESMPAHRGDMTLIYRAHDEESLVFHDEIVQLAKRRGVRVHWVLGSRSDYPRNQQPLGPKHLRRLVGDIRKHDVYVCGPQPLTDRVLRSVRLLGVNSAQIHYESFSM